MIAPCTSKPPIVGPLFVSTVVHTSTWASYQLQSYKSCMIIEVCAIAPLVIILVPITSPITKIFFTHDSPFSTFVTRSYLNDRHPLAFKSQTVTLPFGGSLSVLGLLDSGISSNFFVHVIMRSSPSNLLKVTTSTDSLSCLIHQDECPLFGNG